MRIAITGGTGGVGKALIRAAQAQGHQIHAVVRDVARAGDLAKAGVVLVRGDLDDRDALAKTCEGADALIHMAAHVGDAGTPEEFEHVNVTGTRNAIEAAAKSRVKRFVQLSSTAVYGRPKSGMIDETFEPIPYGKPYEDTKLAAERIAFARGKELGVEVAAVRPPIIFGEDDRVFLPRAIKTVRARRALLIDGGVAPLNLVDVVDVVDVALRCASRPEAAGEVFNVAAAPPPTVRQVFETVAAAVNAPVPRLSLPYRIAMPLARIVDWGWTRAGREGPAPITPFVVTILTRHVTYDASKAKRLLGWTGGNDVLRRLGEVAAHVGAHTH